MKVTDSLLFNFKLHEHMKVTDSLVFNYKLHEYMKVTDRPDLTHCFNN